ncbi:hypothetical protein ABGT15_09720 [Flavobacterium enshiense]|uniref:hypothetical protein n=1 Tax=Flavobacterium enshiense TaxID=1341165 RepID=UPI00345DBF82
MKDFKHYFLILFASFLLAGINFILLKSLFPALNQGDFHFSLPNLYVIFCVASLVILFIQNKVKKKNPEQIGYVFLILTSLKMAVSYAMVYPLLKEKDFNAVLEKNNFFIVFIIFLAMDVVMTSTLLKDVGKKD